MSDELPLVKVVGTSASGKSTLVRALRQRGYNARPASQEHSQIPNLWQQIRPPARLIYLYADLTAQQKRRPEVDWSQRWLDEELRRLQHARGHADWTIDTTELAPEDVCDKTLALLQAANVARAAHPLLPLPETGGFRPNQ